MFFTNRVENASLVRANLDGSSDTILVSHKITYPSGLTLDLPNEHVYWTDYYIDSIDRVDYNGKNRWSLKKRTFSLLKSLHSLVIFEKNLLVSSWHWVQRNQSIIFLNKPDYSAGRQIITNIQQPDALRIYHRQTQPEVPHPCQNGGGCQHLCITAWRKDLTPMAQCICKPGYRLQARTQCILAKHPTFLVYTRGDPKMIKGIPLSRLAESNGIVNPEMMVPILNVKWPLSFDFSVKDQLIYFGHNDM